MDKKQMEGDKMELLKRTTSTKNKKNNYISAKNEDILNIIKASNKKHVKMMKKLAD